MTARVFATHRISTLFSRIKAKKMMTAPGAQQSCLIANDRRSFGRQYVPWVLIKRCTNHRLPSEMAGRSPLNRQCWGLQHRCGKSQRHPVLVVPSGNPDAIISGGGISFPTGDKNARFSYGHSSFKGKRRYMEDFFETRISQVDGQMVAFFGVFDGHGGSRTAEYLKKNLFKNLSSHPEIVRDTKSSIVETFNQTDTDYLNEEKGNKKNAGSTATTAVLVRDKLFVANVGDSRVVACRTGSAIPLSIDHKPGRPDERERIEKAGGFITWKGIWRVSGVLSVSRSFGDIYLRPYVTAEPEIQEEQIDGVEFIIIASDGLWNVLSNTDAVALVQNIADAKAASRKLIEAAYGKGSRDNITCVVVRFES